MPLKEELEKSGNWLFKRRSWLPLLLYPLAIIVIYIYPDITHNCISSKSWSLVCFIISFSGLIIRALTVGFTPKGTSGRNTNTGQVAETLNQTGIYSVVRHPLYLGNFLMWLGLFMYIGIWWFVVICSLLYWLYYERIMYAEEEFLRRNYAAHYESWASQTPAFLPRLSGWVPSKLDFSFRNVMKREYNGLFAMIISFVSINIIAHFFYTGKFYIDEHWQIIFIIGLLAFIILRTLKKNTQILEVQGR